MQKCISYILDDYCSVKSEESQKKVFFAKKCKVRKKLLPLVVNTTVGVGLGEDSGKGLG